MKFGSFGRERDIEFIEGYSIPPDVKHRRIEQTNAAHDLNEGKAGVESFLSASRDAVFKGQPSEREAALILLTRIGVYYPECHEIWDELASASRWDQRFEAACRLYWYIPERHSDRLFNVLRFDRSAKVQEMAVQRYKHRFDDRDELQFDVFDPEKFDERIQRGDVQV